MGLGRAMEAPVDDEHRQAFFDLNSLMATA
jgi:hypothetical protein